MSPTSAPRWITILLLGTLAACSHSGAGERFESRVICDVGAKMGGCAVGDVDPRFPGSEIALAVSDGRVLLLHRVGEEFVTEEVARLPGEMIQCATFDLDPTVPGEELYLVGAAEGGEDDGGPGALWQIAWRSGSWKPAKLLQDELLLHAVCGSAPSGSTPARLYAAGYGGRLHELSYEIGGGLTKRRVARFEGRAKGACAALGGVVLACADGSLRHYRTGEAGTRILGRYPEALARLNGDATRVLFCANDGVLRLLEASGRLDVLFRSGDRLRGAVLADLDGSVPGEEYATAGYDGAITLLRRRGDSLEAEVVARDDDRFHHLASGSLSGWGTVLVGCGYSGRVTLVLPH